MSAAPISLGKRPAERPYSLISAADLLSVQTAPAYVVSGIIEAGCNIGFTGQPESGKSLLALHILACVGSPGAEFHERGVKHGLGVLLCGEGHHGNARRLQALENHYKLGLPRAALVISKSAAPLIEPIELARVKAAIEEAESLYELPLTLLVVDTLARFIAPGEENSAQDMGAYFAAVDYLRGDATAITCHHTGHGDNTRARGSSAWRAALDAEFNITKADNIVTVGCVKMKDGERPPLLAFQIKTVPTNAVHEDGTPVESVVLMPTDAQPNAAKLTGKNQAKLAAVVAKFVRDTGQHIIAGTELRTLAKDAGIQRNRFMEALPTLERAGILTPSVGGWTISHD